MRKILLSCLFALILIESAFATTSTINPNVPAQNAPLASAPIRNNFTAAYNDINNIYASALFNIPAPTNSTLGGVYAYNGLPHNFITGLSTSGNLNYSQPACGDLSNAAASCATDATNANNISSGTLATGRLPALSGDLTSSAGSGSVTVSKINGVTLGSTAATAGNVLLGSGSQWASTAISGDASLSAGGALSINNASYIRNLGTCSLYAYDPAFASKGEIAQGQSLQNFLLDCQKQALALGAATFASTHIPACVEAVTESQPFGMTLSTTIVVPRYVCFNPKNSFVRDGTAGTITSNWTGDPTVQNLANKQQPFFIFPPTTVLTGSLILNLNRNGTDGGSGVAYGKTWRVKSLAIADGGSGFVGGETCFMYNGDTQTPASAAYFTIASASGGAATALTFNPSRWGDSSTGNYYLPPYQQAQQWAISNGWNGSDGLHPQVFDNSGNYRTGCTGTGTGLTLTPTWWPDWCDGTNGCSASTTYDGVFANNTPTTGYLHNIYANQSRIVNDATYGPTYGVLLNAFDLDVDFIQTSFARYGTMIASSDLRIKQLNDVGSWVTSKHFTSGSNSILDFVADSPVDHYLDIDRVSNLSINGRFLNTASSLTGSAAIIVGGDTNYSASNQEANNMRLNISMGNGGSTGGIPAFSCAYMRNSQVNLNVANIGTNGVAYGYQNNKFVNFGSNCEKSNSFTGSIDNVSGSIFSGSDLGVGMNVWDAYAGGYALTGGRYSLTSAGAPTSGGSGTGLNKAGIGSIDVDTTNGALYINTTASSSPTWSKPGGTTLGKMVFNIGGTLSVANDQTNWVISQNAGTITKCYAAAKTGPTGQAIIFDIQKSTNNGSTFTSIWNTTPSNKLQIAAAAQTGNTTAFDTATFNAGDIYRLDVDQIGSGTAGATATVTCAISLN